MEFQLKRKIYSIRSRQSTFERNCLRENLNAFNYICNAALVTFTNEHICLRSFTHHMCKWDHFHTSPGVKPLHTSHLKEVLIQLQPAAGGEIITHQIYLN